MLVGTTTRVYLQYRNVKADYGMAWCNVVNWSDAARFERARSQPGA